MARQSRGAFADIISKVQVNIISLSETAGSATVKYKVGRDAIICSIHTRTCKYTQLQAVSVTSRPPNDKQGSYFQQTAKRNESPDFDCVSVYAPQTRLWHFNPKTSHVFLFVCVLVSFLNDTAHVCLATCRKGKTPTAGF